MHIPVLSWWKWKLTHYRPRQSMTVPGGWLLEFLYTRHMNMVSLSVLGMGRLYSHEIFLALISVWDSSSAVVKFLCYKTEGRWFDSRWCHWNFSLTYSFRSHYDPGVDSASNRKWVPGVFLGGKGGRCVGLTTLPPSSAIVMKCGNLNFLETSGSLQACNGTALPFTHFC